MKDEKEEGKHSQDKDKKKEEEHSEGFRGSLISAAEGIGKLAGRIPSLDVGKQFESARQTVEQSVEKARSTEIGKHLESACETVGESVDRLTGAEFRVEFEKFTDAVTKVVLGIHRDQAELRAQFERLEKVVMDLHAHFKRLDVSGR